MGACCNYTPKDLQAVNFDKKPMPILASNRSSNNSKSDQDKLLSRSGNLFGVQNVKTNPRKERLDIIKVKIGDINYGFKSDGNNCFFTHKFLMCVDDDTYRYIHVYIADPAHPKNKGRKLAYNCVIEFIPTRVSLNSTLILLASECQLFFLARNKHKINKT